MEGDWVEVNLVAWHVSGHEELFTRQGDSTSFWGLQKEKALVGRSVQSQDQPTLKVMEILIAGQPGGYLLCLLWR